MNPRSLFLFAIVIGSASIGAILAVTTHLNPNASVQWVQSSQPTPASVAAPGTIAPLPETIVPAAIEPDREVSPPADQAALRRELMQVKTQLRRAIQERNAKLLRSLIQTGSIRETLRSVELSEANDWEHLDASAWRLLEKAVAYHCRELADAHQPSLDQELSAARVQFELCFDPQQ